MGRVLVSCPLAGDVLSGLAAEHDVVVGERPTGLGKAAILARVSTFDALISMLTDRVDAEVLDAAPALRVVANHAVGVDNIDLAACAARGIAVANTPDVLTDATADFTWTLLLAAARRLVEADRWARSGDWPGWAPTQMIGARVSGATLGIVGCGRIGRAVARRARGFSMRVLYTQRARLAAPIEAELGATYATLDDLLADSDVVSLHVPLVEETKHLLDARRIAAMKRGAILINTARGGCVDEDALIAALDAGHLGAVGLDVFASEPKVPARLARSDRAVLTPHIASADRPTREQMGRLCVEAVRDVLAGRRPPNLVR